MHQTIFGPGEGPTAGNCLSAALASVLEIDIEAVPHFVAHEGDDWFEKMQQWLRENYGLQVIAWNLPEATPVEDLWEPPGITLLTGKSPRGDFNHCVVGRGFEIIHDPHPSGDGLDGRITEIEVFGVLDPAVVAERVS